MQVNVNKPATLYIAFTNGTPRLFKLMDAKGQLYYFRYTDGRVPRIKFNIPNPGTYTSETPFSVVKMGNIEVPEMPARPLPPPERDRLKNVVVKFNPTLQETPARIFTETGVIETSKKFYEFPDPIKLFLLLHEQGHLFYRTEELCDLYAFVNFLRMGYNRSTAYYSLIKILRRNRNNVERVKSMLNNILKLSGEPFDPGTN